MVPDKKINNLEELIVDKDVKKAKIIVFDYDGVLAEYHSLPGEKEIKILERLVRDKKAFIISNMSIERYKGVSQILDLGNIAFIIPEKKSKPHPDAYKDILTVAEKEGIKREEIVVIGDSYYFDVAGANYLGLKTIKIERKQNQNLNPLLKLIYYVDGRLGRIFEKKSLLKKGLNYCCKGWASDKHPKAYTNNSC
ncbi:HAD hydrolase-like protein [Candidatus Woesearchaeota archaeon]|nr:HAD hydrolase-like protein [Candidatus Woesearchaeota archaeon]